MSIVLDHVTKTYAQQAAARNKNHVEQAAVKDVSLQIATGELFVLLGSSGSGKSTLLRLIAGLTPLDGGRIWLNERDVTALPPQLRNTGFVFQNYSLFRHMTVAQNIAFGLNVRHVSRQERDQRVAELLELIQMQEYEDRMPAQLSGGQQQRVALARALAHSPEVLLLDEPFGALDAKIRLQLRQNLHEIQRRLNVTTILVTHDQDEAFELADRIGIIDQGELLEVGAPDELYHAPQHRFTATFLGNANFLTGRRNSHQVFAGKIALQAPPNTEHLANQPVELLSRPEEIELARTASGLQGQLIGRGVIEEIAFAGPLERVSVRLPCYTESGEDLTLSALLKSDEARDLRIAAGQEIWVGLKYFHLMRN